MPRPPEPRPADADARDLEEHRAVTTDPLRHALAGLRSAEHVEADRLEHVLMERMFGVANDPPRIDRFIIIGRLGTGGMGVVYSAYDPDLDRRVAVKLLRDSSWMRTLERERLVREAHALARITHPNVVTVHEVGRLDDKVYVVMEFVVGQTLDAWARSASRTWAEVLGVYRQAGRGLAAAHAAGLVHRDFKPHNAIIGDDGRVRVVDFGLARGEHAPPNDERRSTAGDGEREPADGHPDVSGSPPVASFDASLTRPNTLVGTPAYMSPEQYQQQRVGPSSDQFSFCVALYEALVGVRPFAGDTPVELSANILDGAVREPPRGTRVPAWLLAVVRRGLSVQPRDRFASMDELLAALARDPARTRRRWLLGGAFGGLCGLSVAGLVMQPAADPPCQGAEEALQDVWGPDQRDALRTHLTTLPTPDADQVGARILETLDAYGQRWLDMHHDACLAHHRGEQSGVLLDKRMACLQRRHAALGSAVEVLGSADLETFENAAFMVHDLPPVNMCGDLEVLEAELPVPEDPTVARDVAAARADLARAVMLSNAGRFEEAHRHAHAVEGRARALGYGPLVAEALLVRGRIEMSFDGGDARRPSATLLDAFHEGIASHDDAVAAEAAIVRLYIEAVRPGGRELHEEEDYGLVRSLLQRLPKPERLEALFLNNAGAIAASHGDYDTARAYLRQSLDLKQRIPEINPIEVYESRFNLALMAADETSQVVGLEVALEGFERELGSTHLMTLTTEMVLAQALGASDASQARFADLCARVERSYPTQVDKITECSFDRSMRAAERGELDDAAEGFERVASMIDATNMPPMVRLRQVIAHAYSRHHRGDTSGAIAELSATLTDLERTELPRWLDPSLAELRVALGGMLVESDRSHEAIRVLEPAIETLRRISEHRRLRSADRALAVARLTLARALIDAPSSSMLGVDDPEALLALAERWFRSCGPSCEWRVAEIDSLRERLHDR